MMCPRKLCVVSGLSILIALLICFGCSRPSDGGSGRPSFDPGAERLRMIEQQLVPRGITDQAVLDAMGRVPRHTFVPAPYEHLAYEDRPLPIGYDQTISQPFMVAYMTAALELDGHEKVLEIGTGSGYQAAVLAEVVSEVYTIEIVESLARKAAQTLAELGYENVTVRQGNGYQGWPEQAPFDAILLTAAPVTIPDPLLQQLGRGGRLIGPVGDRIQQLVLIHRTQEGYTRETLFPVSFVPMVEDQS